MDTTPTPAALDDIQPKTTEELTQIFDTIYSDDAVNVVVDDINVLGAPDTQITADADLSVDLTEIDELLLTDDDSEQLPLFSTADLAGMSASSQLLGVDVDPDADVTSELAALSEEDRERMQSLREMAAAENMTMTDAQLLAFLQKFKTLHETTKALMPKKRDVNAKAKAQRRAAAKAAKASRKRNRR